MWKVARMKLLHVQTICMQHILILTIPVMGDTTNVLIASQHSWQFIFLTSHWLKNFYKSNCSASIQQECQQPQHVYIDQKCCPCSKVEECEKSCKDRRKESIRLFAIEHDAENCDLWNKSAFFLNSFSVFFLLNMHYLSTVRIDADN